MDQLDMHRPTRQHRHLAAKIEQKVARSRKSGSKAKRWKKSAENYQGLVKGADDKQVDA